MKSGNLIQTSTCCAGKQQWAKKIGWSRSKSTFIWQMIAPAVHLSAFEELASLQLISVAFVQGLPCEQMPVKFQVSAFFPFFSLKGKGEAQNKLTRDEK